MDFKASLGACFIISFKFPCCSNISIGRLSGSIGTMRGNSPKQNVTTKILKIKKKKCLLIEI